MKILAIDTATSASSIALGDEDQLAAMSIRVDRRGHGGFLVPAIDFAFETAGWKPSDIEVIVLSHDRVIQAYSQEIFEAQ